MGNKLIELKQGNIFDVIDNFDFVIIFGHIGLNQLKYYWDNFRKNSSEKLPDNPFQQKINKLKIQNKFFWFISEEINHGYSDDSLILLIFDIIKFSSENQIKRIVFNGAQDTDHGTNSEFNQNSDDKRCLQTFYYFKQQIAEQKYQGDLLLISLSDSFDKMKL